MCDHGAESFLLSFINHETMLVWEQSTGQVATEPAFLFTQSVHNQPVEKFWCEPNSRITRPMLVRMVAARVLHRR